MTQSSACGVCFGEYNEEKYPVSLACGHVFCCQCIQELSPKICPIDRQPFVQTDVRRIYIDGQEDTPEEQLQNVTDYLATIKRRNNELETQNQQLIERKNEHEQAFENSRRQLISDYETELDQQRKEMIRMNDRLTKFENENRQLRDKLSTIEQVVIQQSYTNSQVNTDDNQPILHGTKRQQQTGKIIGFGRNKNNSFGAIDVNHLRKPTKLNSFETAMYAHPGYNTIVINETGKLMKVTRNGLKEIHMDIPALFVTTGRHEYFAIDSNHRLWSWGSGYLGHGCTEEIAEPKLIEALRHKVIKQVSGHEYLNVCLTMTGEIYIWGKQLHIIGLTGASTPQLIQRQSQVLEIACGWWHVLILQEDGVYAIGQNSKGECGVGDTDPRTEFTKVVELDQKDVIKIACGNRCSAALTRSGRVYVWGGALCGMSKDFKTRPVLMQLTDVIDISLGCAHIIALDRHNRAYAWGWNKFGQCGINSMAEWINTPTRIPNLDDCRLLQITAGFPVSFIKYQ